MFESEQTLLQFFKTIVASSSSTDPQRGLPTSKPSLLRRRTSELHQTVPRKLLEPFQSLDANEYLSSIQDALETTDAQRRVTPRLVDPSFDDQGCGAEHAGFDLVIMGVQEMQELNAGNVVANEGAEQKKKWQDVLAMILGEMAEAKTQAGEENKRGYELVADQHLVRWACTCTCPLPFFAHALSRPLAPIHTLSRLFTSFHAFSCLFAPPHP